MTDIFDQLRVGHHLSKRQREEARIAIANPAVFHRFLSIIADVVESHEDLDVGSLEELFILGVQVADIVRMMVDIQFREPTIQAAAFFYGFSGRSFSDFSDGDPIAALVDSTSEYKTVTKYTEIVALFDFRKERKKFSLLPKSPEDYTSRKPIFDYKKA